MPWIIVAVKLIDITIGYAGQALQFTVARLHAVVVVCWSSGTYVILTFLRTRIIATDSACVKSGLFRLNLTLKVIGSMLANILNRINAMTDFIARKSARVIMSFAFRCRRIG